MNKAYGEARHRAAMMRRCGYPEAQAARQYCIDEIGSDGFYTFTVCIYAGPYKPETIPNLINRAAAMSRSKFID